MARIKVEMSGDLHAPMKEIEEILKKYDIAGFVTLSTRKNAAFKFFLEPSWSLITLTEGKMKIKGSGNVDDELEASLHMLLAIRDISQMVFKTLTLTVARMMEFFDIEHENPFEESDVNDVDRM